MPWYHPNLNRFEHTGRKHTPVFKVKSDSLQLHSIFDLVGLETLQVRIEPPHENDNWTNLFSSPAWLVIFQIFLPLSFFFMAYLLIRELLVPANSKKENSVRKAICSLEILSNLISGIMSASGHFGPTLLPVLVHDTGMNFFSS